MPLKKHYLGEMLIEQIIELKLRGLGPLNRTCTPSTDYFYVKTKISKENLRVDYLVLKYLSTFVQIGRKYVCNFAIWG